MKIALLTIWREKNYGAVLQAFATIKVLQELGHTVEILDINLGENAKHSFLGRVANIIECFSPSCRKFESFWNNYFPQTVKYASLSEIKTNPPQADIYLVGSDQVWNPDITKSLYSIYFLDFGTDYIKRVSYASSFGVSEWNHSELTEKISQLFQRFNHVSCREKSGVEILRKTFGIKAENVIDPTLLFGKFDSFVNPKQGKRNIVCYPLGDDQELQKCALNLAEKLGMDFVDAFNGKKLFGRIIWNRNSIEEWVSTIANADFVITRSFHGMLFSIMFEKNFVVLANQKGRSARLTDFLETIGLKERFFNSVAEIDKSDILSLPIDYSLIIPKIRALRNQSLSILNSMLNND